MPRQARVAVAVIGMVAVAAAVATAVATSTGPSINPDGVSALRMADGLQPLEHPPGHFPEGYPAVLAFLQWLGFGPIGAGRWLGIGLAAANTVLAGLVGWRMAGHRWSVLVAVAYATAASIVSLHAGLYSEPLFIALLLAWLLVIGSQRTAVVAAAGVLAAGAFLVRYGGVALPIAGVLALRSDRRRVLAFTTGMAIPIAVWGVLHVVTGEAVDRTVNWHPPSGAEVRVGIASMATWLTEVHSSTLVGGLVLVASILLLWRVRVMDAGREIGMAAFSYFCVLVLTVVFLDAQTPVNLRLLAPLQVLVVLSLPAVSTVRARHVLVVGVVVLVSLNTLASRRLFEAPTDGMLRLGDGPSIEAARRLDGLIVSNAPGALWLLTGAEAAWIPKVNDPYTGEPTGDFVAAISRLRDDLARGGHVVWLHAFDYRAYLPTEQRLVDALGLRPVLTLPDGTVYRLAP